MAGIAAAAAAASHVTPGQREKAIADAAAAVSVHSVFLIHAEQPLLLMCHHTGVPIVGVRVLPIVWAVALNTSTAWPVRHSCQFHPTDSTCVIVSAMTLASIMPEHRLNFEYASQYMLWLLQAYAANQGKEEKASSAPAPSSSDAGPPREASTYSPPDWAGPPTGYENLAFEVCLIITGLLHCCNWYLCRETYSQHSASLQGTGRTLVKVPGNVLHLTACICLFAGVTLCTVAFFILTLFLKYPHAILPVAD